MDYIEQHKDHFLPFMEDEEDFEHVRPLPLGLTFWCDS